MINPAQPSHFVFFRLRVLIGLVLLTVGVALMLLEVVDFASADTQPHKIFSNVDVNSNSVAVALALPKIQAKAFDGDLRDLRPAPNKDDDRKWKDQLVLPSEPIEPDRSARGDLQLAPIVSGPMPTPIQSFHGLARLDKVIGGQAGSGFPPDANGDVGLSHYILGVNSSYAIYNKGTGQRLAAFTENSLFASGPTGTLCDTHSQGEPIVIYDQLANRWLLTNFAFVSNATTGLWDSPSYQCFAASKSSDPVRGGWWLYAVRIDQGAVPANTLHEYAKFGLWNDGCLYMGANGFSGSNGSFKGNIFGSFNRNDMYNGLPLTSAIGFANLGASLFPANLLGKLPSQMPPNGTPSYFVRNAFRLNYDVRTFTAGADCGGGGVMSAATSVAHIRGPTPQIPVPQPNDPEDTHRLDTLGHTLMQRVQYRKVGTAESLWVVSTTEADITLPATPLWSQLDVSGGTIAPNPVQQGIHAPDTVLWRWMSSLAVDKDGNMAIGYSTSNGNVPNYPSIAYAGRLVNDPPNQLPQTETQLIAGGSSQLCDCGGAPCHRWGEYSSMSIDPVDDCIFWYAAEYYAAQSSSASAVNNWHTRIGAFKFPSCVPAPATNVGAGLP